MTEQYRTLAEKVFDKLNERDPDLIAAIIDEINQEEQEKDKSISIDQYMNANPEMWDNDYNPFKL